MADLSDRHLIILSVGSIQTCLAGQIFEIGHKIGHNCCQRVTGSRRKLGKQRELAAYVPVGSDPKIGQMRGISCAD
jgi:hypothetical protein